MWNWLKTRWLRRQWSRRRATFRFWHGSGWKSLDPMGVYRALISHATFDWASHPKLVDKGDNEATNLTLATIREVFGVVPFDERRDVGLTEAETLNLLVTFSLYLHGLKKSGNAWRTSPVVTEPESSAPTSETITNAESDCGSTSTALKPESAEACSLESSPL